MEKNHRSAEDDSCLLVVLLYFQRFPSTWYVPVRVMLYTYNLKTWGQKVLAFSHSESLKTWRNAIWRDLLWSHPGAWWLHMRVRWGAGASCSAVFGVYPALRKGWRRTGTDGLSFIKSSIIAASAFLEWACLKASSGTFWRAGRGEDQL